jgi:hypothetical protein
MHQLSSAYERFRAAEANINHVCSSALHSRWYRPRKLPYTYAEYFQSTFSGERRSTRWSPPAPIDDIIADVNLQDIHPEPEPPNAENSDPVVPLSICALDAIVGFRNHS